MRAELGLLVLIGAAVAAAPALSQSAGVADAIKARHGHFHDMGSDFKAMGDQLKSASPDLNVVKTSAAKVKDQAAQLPTWFPPGTGPESGLKTRAKAEIWKDPQGFSAAAHKFQDQTIKLAALTQSSTDLGAIRAEYKATGETCGACHDKYRVPKD